MMYQYRVMYTMPLHCTYQRTIHIQLYSVDQSEPPVAEPYLQGFREPHNLYLNNWSGGHVSVDPELVRGIFFCNKKVTIPAEGGVHLTHLAPTALKLMGVQVPEAYDRAPLDFVREPTAPVAYLEG